MLVSQQILAQTRHYKLENVPIDGTFLTVGNQSLSEALAASYKVG